MTKKTLLFSVLSIFVSVVSAQYCGNSGSFQCTASNLSIPWLSPPPDSLPPFVNGQPSTTVIQFKNFNTVFFNGSYYTVNTLRIDTVDNLPAGLCWASNKADNTYANQESGCLKVNGIPCGPTGQYKMRIIVSVDLGFGVAQVNADQAGLKYYIRLKNSADADTQIDTFQTEANPFIAYGGSCSSLPLTAYLGEDPTVCNGSITTLNPLISGGQGPYTYNWSGVGSNLSCQNCANPTVTLTQNSKYFVTVTDANNVTVADTISYTVIGSGNNFQISSSQNVFCQGHAALLSGIASSGFTYQWLRNGNNVPSATNDSLVVASSGNYMLIFTGAGGCYATSNVVSVAVFPKPNSSIAAQPVAACAGDTIHLTGHSDSAVVSYHWLYNGAPTTNATITFNATANGVYKLVVVNSDFCYDTSTVNISFKALPQVALSGNPDTLCFNAGAITLSGGNPSGGTYSGIGVTGGLFSPASAGVGIHSVHYTYTDSASCSNFASEIITVEACEGLDDLSGENLFSLYPNPVNEVLNLEFAGMSNSKVNIAVFDVSGKQQTMSYKEQAGKISIQTGALAPGVYLIKVNKDGHQFGRRFVKGSRD